MPQQDENKDRNLVWLDLEFTTTELDAAYIMQAALIVTTAELAPVPAATGEHALCFDVRLTEAEVADASDWVRQNQARQIERCLRDPDALPVDEVDRRLGAHVAASCERVAATDDGGSETKEHQPVLAGNSIHNDYFLVKKYMPELDRLLSYRLVDVSTLKELVLRWAPALAFDKDTMADGWLPEGFQLAGSKHDALYDVQCSIAELNYYRKRFLRT